MIPSTFVTLDSIPLLPNNKANVSALPKPEYEKTVHTELDRHYNNDCERTLATIWEEVLTTGQFGPEGQFLRRWGTLTADGGTQASYRNADGKGCLEHRTISISNDPQSRAPHHAQRSACQRNCG